MAFIFIIRRFVVKPKKMENLCAFIALNEFAVYERRAKKEGK